MSAYARDEFYRTSAEREEHEAFWIGYAHGLDNVGADVFYLRTDVRPHYIQGYQQGFYDRKRRENHTALEVALAVYMASSRAVLQLLDGVRWANYTREGG